MLFSSLVIELPALLAGTIELLDILPFRLIDVVKTANICKEVKLDSCSLFDCISQGVMDPSEAIRVFLPVRLPSQKIGHIACVVSKRAACPLA